MHVVALPQVAKNITAGSRRFELVPVVSTVYLNIPVFLFKQQETNQLELTTYRDGNMNLKTSASTRSYELSTSRLH